MEIRIKTYDEASSERVKIEVAPGQRVEITFDGALSSSDADLNEKLLDRGAELVDQVAELRGLAQARQESMDQLADNLRISQSLVTRLERDLDTERERADQLQIDLDERPTFGALRDMTNSKDLALGELQTVRAERDRYKEWAECAEQRAVEKTKRLVELQRTVRGSQIESALIQVAKSPEQINTLADAVRSVRRILGWNT